MQVRKTHLARRTALMALAVALAAMMAVGLVAAASGRDDRRCTHGASSIGPVILRNGRVVGGDTTPHTEACLP
jgi:hypothetical protein